MNISIDKTAEAGNGQRLTDPDPQVPVDVKEAHWVTIKAYDGTTLLGIVGYMMAAGGDVPDQTLTTAKGDVTVTPGEEHWYSTNDSSEEVDITEATSIVWSVEVVDAEIEPATALRSAIDASAGLVSSSADLEADVTGPSGAVSWSDAELPSGMTSFEHETLSGDKYHLSLKQTNGVLSGVCWSSEDSSILSADTTLPSEFGASGSITLDLKSSPTVEALYDDYTYA